MQAHICGNLGKKSCNVKEKLSEQNKGGRFFFLTVNEAQLGFFSVEEGGGTDIFTSFYLSSFFVSSRCEVGQDAQRGACHQLSLMFATWHILCYYIRCVFIFPLKKFLWHISPKR